LKKITDDVNWADASILASPKHHDSIFRFYEELFRLLLEEFARKMFGYIYTSYEKGLTVMDQMRTAINGELWSALLYFYGWRAGF
jgi:hypothetical protein